MFYSPDERDYREMLDGVHMKTLAHGDRTSLVEVKIDRGAVIPGHRHSHEQTGYLVAGRLVFTVGGDQFEAVPGSSWCIAGDVEHAAEAVEDCVVVEVFSPVREEYLP
jgi:quercetin dioxygenase-like cupin family protein